jgi:hypothetical protein
MPQHKERGQPRPSVPKGSSIASAMGSTFPNSEEQHPSKRTVSAVQNVAVDSRAAAELVYSDECRCSCPTHPDARTLQNSSELVPMAHVVEYFEKRFCEMEARLRREFGKRLDCQDSHLRVRLGGINNCAETAHTASRNVFQVGSRVDVLESRMETMERSRNRGTRNVYGQPAEFAYQLPHSAQAVYSSIQSTQGADRQTHSHVPPTYSGKYRYHEGQAPTSNHILEHRSVSDQTQVGWAPVANAARRNRRYSTDSSCVEIDLTTRTSERPKLARLGTQPVPDTSQPFPATRIDTGVCKSSSLPVTRPDPRPQPQLIGYSCNGTKQGRSQDSCPPRPERMAQQPLQGSDSRSICEPSSRGSHVSNSPTDTMYSPTTPRWDDTHSQLLSVGQISQPGYGNQKTDTSTDLLRRGRSRGSPSSSNRIVSNDLSSRKIGVKRKPPKKYGRRKTTSKSVRDAHDFFICNNNQSDLRSATSTLGLEDGWKVSDMPSRTRKRHRKILSRMFPGGVEASQKKADPALRAFGRA